MRERQRHTHREREREREREGESMSGGGAEREEERERIPSRLHAVSTEPDARLKLTNSETVMGTEAKSQGFNQLSHPGTPSLSNSKARSDIEIQVGIMSDTE